MISYPDFCLQRYPAVSLTVRSHTAQDSRVLTLTKARLSVAPVEAIDPARAPSTTNEELLGALAGDLCFRHYLGPGCTDLPWRGFVHTAQPTTDRAYELARLGEARLLGEEEIDYQDLELSNGNSMER